MSTPEHSATARAPQRERGRQRVADLLEAASAVFAEKGYAAATMTEIAARADAPIGSLYQFFPNKELLGEALMRRYGERAVAALGSIGEKAAALSAGELAEALLKVFADLRGERATVRALMDASPQLADARGGEFRRGVLAALARILKTCAPRLSAERVDALSLLILLQMKAGMGLLDLRADPARTAATQRELRHMLASHLAESLGLPAGRTAKGGARMR
ncbi:MAG TPA: TetR/AcrR family transcriptional regulator [Dokdonella sp.]